MPEALGKHINIHPADLPPSHPDLSRHSTRCCPKALSPSNVTTTVVGHHLSAHRATFSCLDLLRADRELQGWAHILLCVLTSHTASPTPSCTVNPNRIHLSLQLKALGPFGTFACPNPSTHRAAMDPSPPCSLLSGISEEHQPVLMAEIRAYMLQR